MDRTGADWCALLGRVLLAVLFLPSGVNKLLHLQDTIGAVSQAGVPYAQIAAPLAAAVETVGPILLIVGLLTRWAALMLIVFTAAAAYFFHHYWDMSGAARMSNQINFWKNVAVIGGLLYMVGFGAGRFAIDARRRR